MGRTHAVAILLLSKVVAGTALGILAPEDYVLLFFFLFSTTAGVLLYMADEPVGLLAFFGSFRPPQSADLQS